MNLLVITLCVLMEALLIIAERLPNNQTPKNYNKYVAFTQPVEKTTSTPLYYSQQLANKTLYSYSYNTDTGIQAHEDGHLNHIDTEQEALEARGSYRYTNEGNIFQVSYVANENGFQPEGAHLPTVPPLIKKALQYIAEHPKENEKK
ncbi:endocuticle structural glycoprotein SgAbd-3-like [Anoplolepis gracilipes]|uniref:endocuticle structural glycoprotein SgAbd-3-like n=1 Tax=Anoplolepis gracilipes TaxID=354296 RepID=UPI003BA1995A